FRQNYTFEEAEEIEQDLDKIRRWFDRVRDRDWFQAERRAEVETWLTRCQTLLSGFEEEVYRRQSADGAPEVTPVEEPHARSTVLRPITPLRPARRRSRRPRAN